MYDDIMKALEFASKVHKRQRRTFSNEPYINHPIRMANNPAVKLLGSDAICVALMHDCIEDSDYPEESREYIKNNFNSVIYEACLLLTHDRLVENYKEYTDTICKSENKIVLAVKHADSLDNSKVESSMSDKWISRCRTYYLNSNKYLNILNELPKETKPKDYSQGFSVRTWNNMTIAPNLGYEILLL